MPKSLSVVFDIYMHVFYKFSPGALATEALRPSPHTTGRKPQKPIFMKLGIDGI